MAKGIKTGGRKEGTPNKLTKELRTALKNIMADEIDKLPALLEALPIPERIEFVVKLLPYVVPKVNSVGSSTDEPFSWGIE